MYIRKTKRESASEQPASDRNEANRTDELTDMRRANENIRKSQGEDSDVQTPAHKPAIDRDR